MIAWIRSKSRSSQRRMAPRESLVLAAVTIAAAAVGTHGQSVGSESALRLDAPVRGAVVLVVKGELVGIGTRRNEHSFVTDVQAVDARLQLGRREMVHKNLCV